jgi:uncharacterized membrane protein
VSALASALTESTITASKMALSDALTLANDFLGDIAPLSRTSSEEERENPYLSIARKQKHIRQQVKALASALTESTITASKMALSDALTLANDIQANYFSLPWRHRTIIKNVERRREGEPLPLDRA